MEDYLKSLRNTENALGDVLGIGRSSKKEPLKRKTYTSDFYKLMDKQNSKCADPKCVKRHGKKLAVSTTRDMDHKFPIKLWELMKKKGNPNDISNLQLLCPDCHRIKTAHDKKMIAEYKISKRKKSQSSIYDDLNPNDVLRGL